MEITYTGNNKEEVESFLSRKVTAGVRAIYIPIGDGGIYADAGNIISLYDDGSVSVRLSPEQIDKMNKENKTVVIKDIPDIRCELYGPDDKLIGVIKNEYSWNDVRIQIQTMKLSGYYVIFNDNRIEINSDGLFDWNPKGFYDVIDEQLMQMLSIG